MLVSLNWNILVFFIKVNSLQVTYSDWNRFHPTIFLTINWWNYRFTIFPGIFHSNFLGRNCAISGCAGIIRYFSFWFIFGTPAFDCFSWFLKLYWNMIWPIIARKKLLRSLAYNIHTSLVQKTKSITISNSPDVFRVFGLKRKFYQFLGKNSTRKACR